MFTIKVTYRGQIRKYTFSDLNTFPSYDQICSQLYRVFSISQNFYLSKLLFSPDAAQPARILIGREVHTAYDYNKCIRQFRDRTWPHGLLRFNMCDETLTGIPATVFTEATPISRRSTFDQNQSEMPHIPGSAYFDTMSPLVEAPVSMDSWNVLSSALGRNPPQSAQRSRPTPQHRNSAPTFGACCSVAEAKAEVQAMLVNFRGDLNRVLEDNLGVPVTTNQGSSHGASRNNSSGSLNSAPPPALCSVCTLNISASSNGPDSWYCCANCHLVVCESCHDKSRPGFCLSTMSSHIMKRATTPLIESSLLASAVPIPRLPPPWLPRTHSDRDQQTPSTAAPAAASRSQSSADPVVHGGIICDVCENTIEGVRHKCLDCPDYDLCTPCITSGSAAAHNPFHEFFEITEPGRVIVHTVFSGNGEREAAPSGPRSSAPEHRETPTAAQTPTVHLATCDLCDSRILGDRYKCVKCPDFDTCSSCFSIINEQHPGHPFVRLSKKDDFIRVNTPPRQMHYANCDACSKTIMGTRFKCMHPHCPDYDLCEKCEALPIPVHPQSHPMLKMKTSDTIIPTVYRVGQTNLIRPTQPSVNVVEEKSLPPVVRVFTPMEDDRIPTPKAVLPLPAWMTAPSVFRDESPAPRVASPERPPLPPKPEMISHPSWASIPSFYVPSVNMDSMYTPTSRADNAHGYFANPFADMPVPSPVFEPSQRMEASGFETQTQEKDILLPSVPNHIPNPWPTTNPAERRELLQLIADFAGPSTSAKLISSLSDAPSRRSSRVISEVPSPLLDLSVDSLPTVSSKQASSTKGAEEPPRKDFLPTVPVTPEFFSSLFQRMEDAAEQAFTFEKGFVVDGPSTSFSSPETAQAIKKSDEIPVPEMKQADNATPSLSGFHDFSLSHLLERVEKLNAINFDDIPSPLTAKPASDAESTFSQEALLKRPTEEAVEVVAPNAYRSTLADLINDLPSLVPPKEVIYPQAAPEVVVEEAHPAPVVPLSASFLDDVTVPDGQVFPPGAEFVKCWRLKNDSERDWPESTELVFVAGESLSTEKDVQAMTVELGKVVAGAQIDVWTGELKAPDAPGRYVGYWRLRADGELFGNSLWIEINVAEADSHHSSDESMSASSVIIMPTVSSVQRSQHVPSSTARTASVTASALSTSEDNVSDAGSDISLISMPSSPSGSDDEDDVLWHDSRSYTTEELAAATAARNARSARPSPASAMDYVLLYDDNSSSSSEE